MRSIRRDPLLRAQSLAATIRVADGMPLIWASKVQGSQLPARVAGSDLITTVSAAAADAGRSIFLIGGDPGTADAAASILRQRYPALAVTGTHCPPHGFESDPDQLRRVRARLAEAAPDFVYVGLPFAKASLLVDHARTALPHAWFLGLGISFSFLCNDVSRAPGWMQRTGLEWLHRLGQEPRRLYRRYLLEGLPFAALLLFDAWRHRQPLNDNVADLSRQYDSGV